MIKVSKKTCKLTLTNETPIGWFDVDKDNEIYCIAECTNNIVIYDCEEKICFSCGKEIEEI